MSGSVKAGNQMRLFILTLLTGAFAGAIVWCFLKAVSFGTILIWEVIPSGTGTRFILPALCAAGGLITGVIHHFAGNYPDELNVVLYKVKKEKYYDYRHLAAMLGCAFLPLVFGSSVGPEAGLTGIIAALCYWVGDNVTFARNYSALYSAVGEAVTLGQLFHSPLFGIFAVEESSDEEAPDREPMPKIWKLALYSLSTAASFGAVALLNFLFGKAMSGFPSFSEVSPSAKDYILLVLYFAVGFLMYLFYEGSEHVLEKVSDFSRRDFDVLGELAAHLGHYLVVLHHVKGFLANLAKGHTPVFLQLLSRAGCLNPLIDVGVHVAVHLLIVHRDAVQYGLVQEELLKCQVLGNHAVGVAANPLHLLPLLLHITSQDGFVSDDPDDLVHHIIRRPYSITPLC